MARRKHEDDAPEFEPEPGPAGAGRGRGDSPIVAAPLVGDAELDAALRPRTFDEYVGQRKLVANLKVFVEGARGRGEALAPLPFCGPPGLGKTTLAHVIAHALGVTLRGVGAPAIEHKGT